MTAFLEQDSHTKDRKVFHYSTVNVKMRSRSARSGSNKKYGSCKSSVAHRPNLTQKERVQVMTERLPPPNQPSLTRGRERKTRCSSAAQKRGNEEL